MRVVGKIKSITRLRNSASGNPRLEFLVEGDNGERTLRTSKDTQIAYTFLHEALDNPAVFILDNAGEVVLVAW